MGEYIRYKGQEVKIGTCEDLYYCSFEKYLAALNSGFLKALPGNGAILDYVNIDYGFRFRFPFPFPDEDKLNFGSIIEPYNRGVSVMVSASSINNDLIGEHENILIEVCQQKPVIRDSDGKTCLAVFFLNPQTNRYFSIHEDHDIRNLVTDLVRNNIVEEKDPLKKSTYRAMAIRMLKGYGLDVVSEYKKAVVAANVNRLQDLPKQRKKDFKNRM